MDGIINKVEGAAPMDRVREAIAEQNPEKFLDAVNAAVDERAEKILADALADYDNKIMRARGARQLTSKEFKYYSELITAMRQDNYKDAVREIETVFPETVFDEIFDELEQEHNLISHLDIKHANIKGKLLFAVSDDVKATWGPLTGAITTEVAGEFKEMEIYQLKLSAYIPVPTSMLDLGPVYLDRFVRTLLYEAIANGVEDAVLNNVKSNSGPKGMVVDMAAAATTLDGVTTYQTKTAIPVTEWTPKGLAGVLKAMAKTRNGRPRRVNNLFLVVNPTDYYTIVSPALLHQAPSGDWAEKSPVPVTIVQSPYMADGKAILGIDKRYALGIGTAEAGKLEFSDEFQFLDEKRTYKIKLYGNGEPKDNNAFQLLDISGLKEARYNVNVASTTTVSGTVTTSAKE